MCEEAKCSGYPLYNRDRIKFEIDGCLRIGSDDDDVVQIKNNVEIWEKLLDLCDGQTSINSICKKFVEVYPIKESRVVDFLNMFKMRNIIEILPQKYLYNKKERYFQSTMTYYSSRGLGGYELLDRLQKMHVTILGCGGGGSHIAFQLAQLGVGSLHLVDPDVVSIENVNRQSLFTMDSVGQNKAVITQKMLIEKNPFLEVSISEKRMRTTADVEKEIRDSDWVFCAMDEPPYIAQRIVNRACMKLGIKSVYAFSQKSAGKMFMVNPRQSACCDCLLSSCDSERYRLFLQKYKEASSEDIITANIYTNITLLCAWITKKWLDVVSGVETDPWNKLYRYSFDTFTEEIFLLYDRIVTCPTCGNEIKTGGQETEDSIWRILEIE